MNDLQLDALNSRLDILAQQVSILVDRQKKQEAFFDELVLPVAKEMMKSATKTLEAAEQQGVFEFGHEVVQVGRKILENYSADDVRRLGDSVVKILDAVRSLTQPDVMNIASEAGDVLQHVDQIKPTGLFGVVKATRDDDVSRGLGAIIELLRRVGKGAAAVSNEGEDASQRQVKVTALVAPIIDLKAWSKALGENLAAEQGVNLTEAHWKVVEFARGDFERTKASPNVRRISQEMGIQTKALYGLFPKAPARTIAKIAGLPKPAGCL